MTPAARAAACLCEALTRIHAHRLGLMRLIGSGLDNASTQDDLATVSMDAASVELLLQRLATADIAVDSRGETVRIRRVSCFRVGPAVATILQDCGLAITR